MRDIFGDGKAAEKPAFDLNSRSFHAKKFIKEMVGSVSHGNFEVKLVEINNAAKEAGEELKHLIRDNLATFISFKDAMTAVYDRDKGLFTGEALEDISAAFSSTLESCRELIEPITGSFLSLCHNRRTQEILEKLFSVLSVPGTLYESCGVYVARRKTPSESWKFDGLDNKDSATESLLPGSIHHGKADGNDALSTSTGDSSDVEADTSTSVRGALEDFVNYTSSGAAAAYVLQSDQEVFYWHSVPLVRLKDAVAQRRHVEAASNYGVAVLGLRRAMLYFEENYNLEDGTLLLADDTDSIADRGVASPAPHECTASDCVACTTANRKGSGAVSRTPFTYYFVASLLKATLYLEDQLAEELLYANVADMVLIEDTLSMMMDVAIASVKLHHFCSAMQHTVLCRSEDAFARLHENATKSAFATAALAADTLGGGLGMASLKKTAGRYSDSDADHGGTISTLVAAAEKAAGPGVEHTTREKMHPAQHFISIVRDQSTRLTRASAAALLSEATEWLNKLHSRTTASSSRLQAKHSPQGRDGAAQDAAPHLVVDASSSWGCAPDRPGLRQDSQPATGVDVHAGSILRAFRTPEGEFAAYTTFSIGAMDMSDVLESSCAQIHLHASAMLQHLCDRADSESAIMAQSASLSSFASRLSEVCITNVEHVIISYWAGTASGIHAGIFDFYPDTNTPLYRMLRELLITKKVPATASLPLDLSRPPSTVSSFSATFNEAKPTDNTSSPFVAVASGSQGSRYNALTSEVLPEICYVPVLPESLHARDRTGEWGKKDVRQNVEVASGCVTLRNLSVQAVHHMVRSAKDTLYSLHLAFVNRAVLNAFVRGMSQYTLGDLSMHAHDERLELHAAVLVEVILGQWERMMMCVDQSVLRIKVAIGESCSTTTINAENQVNDVVELLAEIEQLRSTCFSCYLHGIGMLSKAYVSLLPMLIPTGIAPASLEYRVRARLSRNFMSSSLPNKLLNLLSVVMDRVMPFFQRHTEIHDSAGLFAAKAFHAETLQDGARGDKANSPTAAQRPRRVPRRNHSRALSGGPVVVEGGRSGTTPDTGRAPLADASTLGVAGAHVKLVLSHVGEHEELVQALVADLLLSFIDMLHNRCRIVTVDTHVELEERESNIMECVADALCMSTTIFSTVLEHMLAPCLFSLMADLHTASPPEVTASVKQREQVFQQKYLPRVGEHCQLAVDAMLRMYIAAPQQRIAREIRLRGFMVPLFDWQRISSHAAAAVRPYISNCIVHVARARETLDCIHQPALAAAVTQRLVAHLAMSFVTAVGADVNAFEMSLECSPAFLNHAMLLIEAEACTVLALVDAVANNTASFTPKGVLLSELQLSRKALKGFIQAFESHDTLFTNLSEARAPSIAPEKADNTADSVHSQRHGDKALPNVRERAAQRDEMVATAVAHLKYMIDALNSHLMESFTLRSELPHSVSGEAMQSIADRLTRRREGYEVRRVADNQHGTQGVPLRYKTTPRADDHVPGLPRKEGSRPHSALPLAQDSDSTRLAAAALYQSALEQKDKKPNKSMCLDRRPARLNAVAPNTAQQQQASSVDFQIKSVVDKAVLSVEAKRPALTSRERRVHCFKRSNVI